MVSKQCVACNHKVPGTKKICVCGHVFKQTKMIGGKRYSGYRAMLHSRRSSRKWEARKRPGHRLMTDDERRTKKRLSNSPKPRRLSKDVSTNEVLLGNKQPQKSSQTKQDIYEQSPELLLKLSKALNDINKRIARQSLLWIILKSARY